MTKESELAYEIRYVSPKTPLPVFPAGQTAYVDLETYKGEYGDALTVQANRVRFVTFTTADGEIPIIYVVDMLDAPTPTDPRWRDLLISLDSYETICGHNLSFDLPILLRHGLPYPRKVRDTIIASRVLRNGIPFHHGYANLILEYLGIRLPKDLQSDDWGVRDLTPDHIQYAACDVAYLPTLHTKLVDRLTVHKLVPIYELECSIVPAIASMTLNGVLVDRDMWAARAREAEREMAVLTPQLMKEFPLPDPEPLKSVRYRKSDGKPFEADLKYNRKVAQENETRTWNLASPLQVKEMFSKIEIELPNTAYETMVAHRDDHPVVDKFLQWRDLEKQAGTFGVEWLTHIHPNGRVHPNWMQLGAASGRFTCSSPNMQQVPRGDTRKAIIAPPGKVFVRADFSQIEARVAAKISGDPVLTELFQDGGDIHAEAAKAVLGKLTVTPAERQIGKSLVFGLLFSMSAPSLRVYCSTNYGVKFTREEAELYRERFFRTFYGLARWHDRIRKDCNYAQVFHTLVGRRRIVAHLAAQSQRLREEESDERGPNMLGLGLNTPVQGTAADMLKIAVRELWDRREEFPRAELVMLVHDEIVYEVPEGDAEEFAKWLRDVMIEAGNVILDPIPCDASVKIGRSWGG